MKAKFVNEFAGDNSWVDVKDKTEKSGYYEIQYYHQTAEDDYEINDTAIIDPHDMDVYLGLSFGLSLEDIDNGLGVTVEDIEKLSDYEWNFKTNHGELVLTLDKLEHLANTTQRAHSKYFKK